MVDIAIPCVLYCKCTPRNSRYSLMSHDSSGMDVEGGISYLYTNYYRLVEKLDV